MGRERRAPGLKINLRFLDLILAQNPASGYLTFVANTNSTPADLHSLALDFAICEDLNDAEMWATQCVWVYEQAAAGVRFTIGHGSTFQCIMLAQMDFLAGPTDIHTMDCNEGWTALAA